MVRDREAWRAAVHGVSEGDQTTTMERKLMMNKQKKLNRKILDLKLNMTK